MTLSILMVLIYLMLCSKSALSMSSGALILFSSMLHLMMSNESVEMNGWVTSDYLSCSLISLTILIIVLMTMMSLNVNQIIMFNWLMQFICLLLIMCFATTSFFLFFFFFESVLAPVLFMILIWGYQPERMSACTYMIIYTSIGSLPFLFGISNLVYWGMSCSMVSKYSMISKELCCFYYLYLLGFLVKLPVFPFHLWLPKAHVEAPVAGSMILAGVLLKLGGYGMIRFMSVILVPMTSLSYSILLSTCLVGGLFASFMCVRQVDLKSLIAYSSVGHMSVVVSGILSASNCGVVGAILLMLGHGLCSSGLFSLVFVLYCNSNSRSILLNKGIVALAPGMAFFSFLLCSSNMSAPLSLSFLGEVMVFVGCMKISFFISLLLGFISFLSACYSLYFYGLICHGKSNVMWKMNVSFVEYLVCLIHWFPLNFLFLFCM
uniref:NADH-ubiquinone oxidoreductase chain 4 n=1 Tax=Geukensia demissa TaxID=27807 RepID=A0A6B9VNC7_GEUDE|nr:NADH dehydrogenase subunit 4 [Geukensia demissa]